MASPTPSVSDTFHCIGRVCAIDESLATSGVERQADMKMSSKTSWSEIHRRANAAEDVLEAMTADADNMEIARAVADYLLVKRPPHHLSIFHDVRPSTPKRIARIRKDFPNYQGQPHGPCPLHYDWRHKNTVGISTRDESVARQWIIDAMLLGYGVFRHIVKHSGGSGQGSIAAIRSRIADRRNTEGADSK